MSVPYIFVVEMLRWGDRELHSYVEGVYGSESEASAAALEAEDGRGGKYTAEISAFVFGAGRQGLVRIKTSDTVPEGAL